MGKRWFPLESNPGVMNDYIQKLGATGSDLQFVDVWGMTDELLAMVPGPSHAVLFLFPVSERNEAWREEQQAAIAARGDGACEGVSFMHQTIDNACGTVAILHALLNNVEKLEVAKGSFLEEFMAAAEGKSSEEMAEYLEGSDDLDRVQEEAAQQGQTEAPPIEEEVQWHFICYIHRGGRLYELDGRKAAPVDCGQASPETLLHDTARYVQKYMALDPDELHFTLTSLSSV